MRHDVESKRLELANKVLSKFPDRVPIQIQTRVPNLLKRGKFMVPRQFTLAEFILNLRHHYLNQEITQGQSIHLIHEEITLIPSHLLMCEIYETYKAEDGFLYFELHIESVFGS